jgi:N-acetylneuraminic acid mutarotase
LVAQLLATSALAAESNFALEAVALRPLPAPVTNNAVTAVTANGRSYLVSFNGLAKGRSYSDTLSVTYVLDVGRNEWTEATPVPGGVGRLASAAVSVGNLAYVFGGYSVAEDGTEVSTPWAHSFAPGTKKFIELSAMPVPVDDAVAVTYADRYLYLISGWHDLGNVNLVQRYDTQTDSWDQATPIPGKALFGHAGGIVGNQVVFCDGVAIRSYSDRPRDYVASSECFLGIIDADDSRRIDWRSIDAHPGLPRYRMAAAGVPEQNAVLFIGGSDNPYNYSGIGYNGEPSEPSSGGLRFDLDSLKWHELKQSNPASMDHRALAVLDGAWLTIGGMLSGQTVTDKVVAYK